MSDGPDFESLSPTEQFILCGVAEFERRDRTPVRTPDLRQFCRVSTTSDESRVVGTVSEADAMRSLYRLESAGVVSEEEPDATSPVGKGRPAYSLVLDAGTVLEERGDGLPDVEVPGDFRDR